MQDALAKEKWTVFEVLRWTTQRFSKHGMATPRLDAEILLAHCLSVDRLRLYLDCDKPLAKEELQKYGILVRRRLKSEPVAYLIGEKEFWSLRFEVNPSVLVPRPETELLVEIALAWIDQKQAAMERSLETECVSKTNLNVVDLGTGSGAVAIALAHERPDICVWGVDVDPKAVTVAKRNAERNNTKVSFCCGDLLASIPSELQIDLLVANLPYVPTNDFLRLNPEVRDWEPRVALDGGQDGLDLVRRLITEGKSRVKNGAFWAFEIDPSQAQVVKNLLSSHSFGQIQTHRDLAGLDRVVSGVFLDQCRLLGHGLAP
ncbi:MAG: peptide chain release factor N(5)-glutamine methyltransferase [Pseudomonadota bacterium]